MSFREEYFEAFSEYLRTEDTKKLLPYLRPGSNPAYLKIYRNGAIKSGLNALASNFPTLKKLLGDELFNTAGRNYVLHQWPSDSCLSSYGDTFPAFLNNQAALFPENSIDFAALDRAWLDALFAKDEEFLAGDAVVKMIQNDCDKTPRISLVNSVRIVSLGNQCLSAWIKLKFGAGIEPQDFDSKSVIMWRRQEFVYYRALDHFELIFINWYDKSCPIWATTSYNDRCGSG